MTMLIRCIQGTVCRSLPARMAVLVIGFELMAGAIVVFGIGRWMAALAHAAFSFAATLFALRFRQMLIDWFLAVILETPAIYTSHFKAPARKRT